LVLSFLDKVEEFRDLSLEEWNFRLLVQDNLNELLEQQKIYWCQRGLIKWAWLGDENTKVLSCKCNNKALKEQYKRATR
jgi:hypothetical protein